MDVKKQSSFNGNGLMGLALIVAGGLLVYSNLTGSELFTNWWVVFMFIPILASFGYVYNSYRETGTLNPEARGALGGAAFMSLIAAFFIFDLSWALLWPVGLIMSGILVLSGAFNS